MRLVPAGVSKTTGKPYNSFLACPNRCPKPQRQYQPQNAPQSVITPNLGIREAQERKEKAINSFQETKDESMRILNAKNIAGDWVRIMIEKGFIEPAQIEGAFKKYCDYVYSYNPNLGFSPNEIF